jgi:phosphatidylinositol-3-phosphatase
MSYVMMCGRMVRALLCALFLCASLSPARAASSAPVVFEIILENHNWLGSGGISGSSQAPYINHTLVPMAAVANNYFNPYGIHPSLPNYIWMEAGSTLGVRSDGWPTQVHFSTHLHLTYLLQNAGVTWRDYAESISGQGCPLWPQGGTDANGSQLYQPRHVGALYFDDNTNSRNAHSAYCMAHIRPFWQLATDLKNNTIARYNIITPNMCDDGHDACGGNSIAHIDTWLKSNLPLILNSWQYKNGHVVIMIATDEASNGDGPIPFLVLGAGVKRGYKNEIRYTHSSLLRTLQEIFKVGPYLGYAAQSNDLKDLFWTLP